FERIREVGKGYTIIGTKYTYNARNQLVHLENAIRYEEYDYTYDDAGNMLTNGRSQYEWNVLGQLRKVTFPDGFGEKYAYDMLGRRVSKTQFNHAGSTQEVTQYTYKGDTWAITEELDAKGNVTKSYTYDANDRPLTITMEGQTFWYVYNGHGDVVALTDKDGKVAARYEYDAWGLVTRMYNGLGERVREGIGWIGDLGTGNGSPGSVQGPEDESGNTDPDYHPGNGNGKGNGKNVTEGTQGAEAVEATSTVDGELTALLAEVDIEPTDDLTTELVKENPYRYAGYYWDRKTQYYYLQARYYDPRLARFISEDTYEGEIHTPLSLNQYVYVENNPLSFSDPTGHYATVTAGVGGNSDFYFNLGRYRNKYALTLFLDDISKARNAGRSNQVYWTIRSDWGTQFKTRHIISEDKNNNQFRYLFELSTLTREYKYENNVGNARWATFQFLDELDPYIDILNEGKVAYKKAFQNVINFMIVDDINTIIDPSSPLYEKALALAGFIPVGKIIKNGQLIIKFKNKSGGTVDRAVDVNDTNLKNT
ncbi:RHS repeat-associated core domain-containing protein, partial [Paenibacillus sp. LHD-117]|uniref:RHS repeat-associated core domain-containing protein n=1 Tax=Paenibacillus sp. LHD-117 TaxID=3071412 RepID=UPI0027E00E2D